MIAEFDIFSNFLPKNGYKKGNDGCVNQNEAGCVFFYAPFSINGNFQLYYTFSLITSCFHEYLNYAQFCFVNFFITNESNDLVISENIIDGIKNRITSKVEHPH